MIMSQMMLLLALSSVGYGGEDSLLLESEKNGQRVFEGLESEAASQEQGEVVGEEGLSEKADDHAATQPKAAKVSDKERLHEKAMRQDGEGGQELSVAGVYGWGLGLSFPIAGLVAGLGSDSRLGAGYHLGGVLSLEVIPRFELRLGVHQTMTYGGRASIHYTDGNVERFSRVDAEWVDLVFMGGVAYLHRDLDWPWIPFFGFDFGVSFHGYYYALPSQLSTLLANDTATQFLEGGQDGLTLGWRATFRVGGRLSVTKWLETSLELAIDYTSLTDNEPVSNTVLNRKVQTLGEDIFLFRLVFSVWMGV